MLARNKRSQSLARLRGIVALAAAAAISLAHLSPASAGNSQGGAVGGVRVDLEGIVANVDSKGLDLLRKAREEALRAVPSDIAKPSAMRKISLRRMAEAIAEKQDKQAGGPLGDEFEYLAGLQRIEYVFVYPQQKDIVLAGPAAGWKINGKAEVVGANTGLPVLMLDDLLTSLQNVEQARKTTISCSIDPTAEGIQRLNAFLKQQKTMNAGVKEGVETSLGKQNVTLTGVPATSRYAHVMLAADYRMKRYAMGLESAPISGMPSYLELLRTSRGKPAADLSPRWWIAADYKPLLTDGEGLAWQIQAGVRVMSEDERRTDDGKVQGTGKTNAVAKKWADTMTGKYKDLAAKDSIFAQLQNCMDLAVVAALISKEKLADHAGLDLTTYLDNKRIMPASMAMPKHVQTEVSTAKSGREWLITASGGVQFSGFDLINKRETSEATKKARAAAMPGTAWWWD